MYKLPLGYLGGGGRTLRKKSLSVITSFHACDWLNLAQGGGDTGTRRLQHDARWLSRCVEPDGNAIHASRRARGCRCAEDGEWNSKDDYVTTVRYQQCGRKYCCVVDEGILQSRDRRSHQPVPSPLFHG